MSVSGPMRTSFRRISRASNPQALPLPARRRSLPHPQRHLHVSRSRSQALPLQPPSPGASTSSANPPKKVPPGRPYSYDADAHSFHPAMVGAIFGAMSTLAISYTWYVMSGAKELLQSAREKKQRLDIQFEESFKTQPKREPLADQGKAGADGKARRLEAQEERFRWFRSTAANYAAFVPGATVWLDNGMDHLERTRGHGGKRKRDEVDEMVERCARDLDTMEPGWRLNKNNAKAAWTIVYSNMFKLSGLDESRSLSGETAVEETGSTRTSGQDHRDEAEERDLRAQRLSGWFRGKEKDKLPRAEEQQAPAEPAADESPEAKKLNREAQVRAAWLKSRSRRD